MSNGVPGKESGDGCIFLGSKRVTGLMHALGLNLGPVTGWQIPAFCFARFDVKVDRDVSPPMTSVDGFANSSDVELFAQVRTGDAAAFAEFYDRHAPRFFGIALKVLGNEQDAEDVLQEAAVLIWERAPRYDAALGQPVNWAVALTRNKAIDRLRSVRRRTEVVDEAAEEPVAAPVPEPISSQKAMVLEAVESVQTALGSLSSDQRQAIELAFFGGLTQQEIAARLDQPLGTIKARIRRGMMTLRDLLEGQL